MWCENCSSKHDGSYGSGRFCTEKCARGFSTKASREEINAKVSKSLGGKNYVYIPKEKQCLWCGSALSKTAKKFCSGSCFHLYKYNNYINRWLLGLENGRNGKLGTSKHIRKYMFIKYDSKCQECDWSKENIESKTIPLELHHVDGNFKNNKEENLQLLCPNCHSITATYKALNKNNKRVYTQIR